MSSRSTSVRRLVRAFLATITAFAGVCLAAPGPAEAETIFVPIEFGASYEPQQLNNQLVQSAIKYGKGDVVTMEKRDEILDSHFPELTLPNVSDLEQKFASGRDDYVAGNLQPAKTKLSEALAAASERLVALTLRPGFAESTYQGGTFLIQTLYFGLGEKAEAEKVISQLVQLFPTQVPDEAQFPPELIELYQSYLPGSANGNTLTVIVGDGCYARINGKDLPQQKSTNIVVLPGTYGVSEVCEEQTVRAFVVPVDEDVTIDFHDAFANAFTYPISLGIDARDKKDTAFLKEVLVKLGDRTGVGHVMAAGLMPETDAYRVLLVDVEKGTVVREVSVPPSEVATAEGMDDVVNHLWTGEELEVVVPEGGAPVDWTMVGGITAGVGGAVIIGGVITGVLAMQANDEFESCNVETECRQRRDDIDALRSRDRQAIIADVLYGTGAAFTVAGVVMIIVDQVGGGGTEAAEEEQASDWHFNMRPTRDGGMVDLRVRF